MRSGRLRHRLSLQGPTITNDGLGTPTTTFGTVATIWGSIEPLKGKEFYDSALINSEVTNRIVVRYITPIAPNYKVVFGTRTFMIESIIDLMERRKELHLMVVEEIIK